MKMDGFERTFYCYDLPSKTAKTSGDHEADSKEKVLVTANIRKARAAGGISYTDTGNEDW